MIMDVKKTLDVDGNGKVNWRDAQKALDESEAKGSMKFVWGVAAGVLPFVLWLIFK